MLLVLLVCHGNRGVRITRLTPSVKWRCLKIHKQNYWGIIVRIVPMAVIKTNVDSTVHHVKNAKMGIYPLRIKVGASLKVLIRKFFSFLIDY